jgi:hypothetical protein
MGRSFGGETHASCREFPKISAKERVITPIVVHGNSYPKGGGIENGDWHRFARAKKAKYARICCVSPGVGVEICANAVETVKNNSGKRGFPLPQLILWLETKIVGKKGTG